MCFFKNFVKPFTLFIFLVLGAAFSILLRPRKKKYSILIILLFGFLTPVFAYYLFDMAVYLQMLILNFAILGNSFIMTLIVFLVFEFVLVVLSLIFLAGLNASGLSET